MTWIYQKMKMHMVHTPVMENAFFLALNILGTLSPRDSYVVVNIAKSNNPIFSYPSIPEIPSVFGYNFDKVPQILEEEEVICAKVSNRWYINRSISLWKDERGDALDIKAHALGILPKKNGYGYYKARDNNYTRSQSFGPIVSGQYAALISVERLKLFVGKSSEPVKSKVPQMIDGKYLEFMGERIEFSGLELRAVACLVKNIGSIVSVQDFCETDPDDNYDRYVKEKKLTELDDKLSKRLEAIRRKIKSNSVLSKLLVPAKQEGFGLFVNQSASSDLNTP
jgi:hypothetical protein